MLSLFFSNSRIQYADSRESFILSALYLRIETSISDKYQLWGRIKLAIQCSQSDLIYLFARCRHGWRGSNNAYIFLAANLGITFSWRICMHLCRINKSWKVSSIIRPDAHILNYPRKKQGDIKVIANNKKLGAVLDFWEKRNFHAFSVDVQSWTYIISSYVDYLKEACLDIAYYKKNAKTENQWLRSPLFFIGLGTGFSKPYVIIIR